MPLKTNVLFLFYLLLLLPSEGFSYVLCEKVYKERKTLSLGNSLGANAVATPQRATPRPAPRRGQNDKNNGVVFREPELIQELVYNRKFPPLTSVTKEGNRIIWFLATSNNGRLYRVVTIKDRLGEVLDTFADLPLQKVERLYYHRMSEFSQAEPFVTTLSLPRKGKRKLVIPPQVLIKLDIKHDMSPEHLVAALRRIPKGVEYRYNNNSAYAGKDSFIFFVEMGQRTPLEVVMMFENNTYFLVTAFYPNVFRQ